MKRTKIKLHNKYFLRPQAIAIIFAIAVIGTALTYIVRADATITTVKSGLWSSPSTWSGNRVPGVNDEVTITAGHDVLYDVVDSKIHGMTVAGTVTFDPNKSVKLDSDANVVVNGQLAMVPKDATINHTLRFMNVNEGAFVGGGMDVLPSDVGLWVMGDGQLYTKGTQRSGWLRMANGISQGTTSFTLESTPVGWQVGDKISIAPNEYGKGFNDFHETTITAINGAVVSFSNPTTQNHAKVNNLWGTEVMNLTRNVIIGGTVSGKSHSFIRSTKPQFIRYTTFQHMGPRNASQLTNNQTGRYGLHFHHGMDGSIGSIVEGTIVADTNNHAYVPHMSHGITFKDTISYNTKEDAYWWDDSEITHDVLYDHAMAAKIGHHDPDGDRYEYAGFFLGAGDGNAIRNSVGVGINGVDGGAFFWNNGSSGLWEFDKGNVSHNNVIGMRVWQNTGTQHTIRDLVAYHNEGAGVVHGAYNNDYLYEKLYLYANGPRENNAQFSLGANSRSTAKIRVVNSIFDAAGKTQYGLISAHSAVPSQDDRPNEFRGITFRGYTTSAIHLDSDMSGVPHKFDVIDPVFENANEVTVDPAAVSGSWVRIQKPNASYRVSTSGTTPISRVAPTSWGTGTGLLVSWFDDQNLQDLKATDVFQYIQFESEELEPPNHRVNNPDFSARFEGQIEAQRTETYTFHTAISDGQRLYINNQLVIDSWRNQLAEPKTGTFAMVAGQKYDFKLEVYEEYNQGSQVTKGAINVEWSSPSTPRAYIPTSQFYPKLPHPQRDPVIAADPSLPSYVTGVNPTPTPPTPTPTPPTPPPPAPSPTPPSPTPPSPTPTPPSPTATPPTPAPKAGDINGDGFVNLTDFFILRTNFGKTGMTRAQGDLNGDGTINLSDFFVFRTNFGQ